jgi:hypothetical protein
MVEPAFCRHWVPPIAFYLSFDRSGDVHPQCPQYSTIKYYLSNVYLIISSIVGLFSGSKPWNGVRAAAPSSLATQRNLDYNAPVTLNI